MPRRNTHLVKAIGIMNASVEAPMSPADIAVELGISMRQLERTFGKYLNTSPQRYYMDLRLERGRRLLIQTEGSVTEVALACGFQSTGHFTRVYRATYGVTPSAQHERIN